MAPAFVVCTAAGPQAAVTGTPPARSRPTPQTAPPNSQRLHGARAGPNATGTGGPPCPAGHPRAPPAARLLVDPVAGVIGVVRVIDVDGAKGAVLLEQVIAGAAPQFVVLPVHPAVEVVVAAVAEQCVPADAAAYDVDPVAPEELVVARPAVHEV